MTEFLTDTSPAALIAAVEANFAAYMPFFAAIPGGETHLSDALCWSITDADYPVFNSILGARLSEEQADVAVAAAIDRGRRHNVPVIWWVGPGTRPADLGRHLEGAGFVPVGAVAGMAADLARLDETRRTAEGFAMTRVADEEALRHFTAISAVAHEMSPAAAALLQEWDKAIGLGPDVPLRHYLGWLDGEPVAVGSLLLAAGVAGIYNVGTLPAARRKGIGAALTLEPLLEARTLGYRVGVLQSSTMGLGVYTGLSFREYCSILPYLWDPSAPAPTAS